MKDRTRGMRQRMQEILRTLPRGISASTGNKGNLSLLGTTKDLLEESLPITAQQSQKKAKDGTARQQIFPVFCLRLN